MTSVLIVSGMLVLTFIIFWFWEVVFDLYLDNDNNWKGGLYGLISLVLSVSGAMLGTVAILGVVVLGWGFVLWLF